MLDLPGPDNVPAGRRHQPSLMVCHARSLDMISRNCRERPRNCGRCRSDRAKLDTFGANWHPGVVPEYDPAGHRYDTRSYPTAVAERCVRRGYKKGVYAFIIRLPSQAFMDGCGQAGPGDHATLRRVARSVDPWPARAEAIRAQGSRRRSLPPGAPVAIPDKNGYPSQRT